jgi:hypothetical protein
MLITEHVTNSEKKERTRALQQYFGSTETTSEAFQVQKDISKYRGIPLCRKSQSMRM